MRGLTAFLFLVLLGWGVYEAHGRQRAQILRERLLNANMVEMPAIVADAASYRSWLDPLLRDAYAKAEAAKDAHKQLPPASLYCQTTPAKWIIFMGGFSTPDPTKSR